MIDNISTMPAHTTAQQKDASARLGARVLGIALICIAGAMLCAALVQRGWLQWDEAVALYIGGNGLWLLLANRETSS